VALPARTHQPRRLSANRPRPPATQQPSHPISEPGVGVPQAEAHPGGYACTKQICEPVRMPAAPQDPPGPIPDQGASTGHVRLAGPAIKYRARSQPAGEGRRRDRERRRAAWYSSPYAQPNRQLPTTASTSISTSQRGSRNPWTMMKPVAGRIVPNASPCTCATASP
jgi:hypothetical protein